MQQHNVLAYQQVQAVSTIVIVSPVTRQAVRDYQVWVQQHNVLAYQQVQVVSTIVIVSPVTHRAVRD